VVTVPRAEESGRDRAYHLAFSALLDGPLDWPAMHDSLRYLTRRHDALRTVFVRSGEACRWRVLASWEPVVVSQVVRAAPDADPVGMVSAQVASSSSALLAPFERPPVVFVATCLRESGSAGEDQTVLTVLAHRSLIDVRSAGVLWRDLAQAYQAYRGGGEPADGPAPSISLIGERAAELRANGHIERLLAERCEAMAGLPAAVRIPSDLPAPAVRSGLGHRLATGLSAVAIASYERLARSCPVDQAAVLLAAWGLTIGRRCGLTEFLIGLTESDQPAGRPPGAVGPWSSVVAVHIRLADGLSRADYVRSVADRLTEARAAADVGLDELAARLDPGGGDVPLAGVRMEIRDEIRTAELTSAGLAMTVTEGHCGGADADVTLVVTRSAGGPTVAVDYATEVLTSFEAADLADSFHTALAELAADSQASLGTARTISAAQRARLEIGRRGRAVDTGVSLWELVARCAARYPDAPAVEGPGSAEPTTVSYAELIAAAESCARVLAEAGVAAGDDVAIAVPRSPGEIVVVLGVLRLGAAYCALDLDLPDARLDAILRICAPRAIVAPVGATSRLTGFRPDGCALVEYAGQWQPARPAAPLPDPPPRGDQTAYIAFTSGSTGPPKAAEVPQRAVVRLVRDADYVHCGPGERFLRFAPLAFDASTLEIFAPLSVGGTVVVHPDLMPAPAELAAFLTGHAVTVLWLTSGLFRVMADRAPEAFASVRQVLTGGDVVPPGQVADVLGRHPGLTVTNGYGPTENTTFSTTHQVDDPCAVDWPLPIGRPIQGSSVVVLDQAGGMVPPGGIGELYVGGEGLAKGYRGDPEETARAFGHVAPDTGERLYRTGDLVRWDRRGRLAYLGRADDQVKIRGYRVEPGEIVRRLLEHPQVTDAVVMASEGDSAARFVIAGVVADTWPPPPGLAERLRAHLARTLPPYATPARWAFVERFPVTGNGKLDQAALRAQAAGEVATQAQAVLDQAASGPAGQNGLSQVPSYAAVRRRRDLEQMILAIWREVLDVSSLTVNDRFFDVGGDSLRLAVVADKLRRSACQRCAMEDLFRYPTVRSLANHLLRLEEGDNR
jgi:amino acid adenylation domain-containing protein